MQLSKEIANTINELGVCVIIPTYNNEHTLAGVIEGVLKYTNNVIIVNDGATDSTSTRLQNYPHLYQVAYSPNKGKGFALRAGFKYALEKGFKYAITIDSDGQHNTENILLFFEKLITEGPCMIIGERNMEQDSVPGKSNFGRKFSNFWFRVETGIKNNDTQSGFRLYPLEEIRKLKFFTRKFEFEIEALVRLAWEGVKVVSVPVSVTYFPKETRVSHFRPFIDFTRISILNTLLVILAFVYFKPRLFFKQNSLSSLLFSKHETTARKSLSVALGIFMGIIPIWGFQLVTAIALAFLFKLNKALVIIFANISIPPMIPLILYLSMQCGKWFVPEPQEVSLSALNLETLKPFMIQYIYGSIALTFISAILAGFFTYALVSFFNKNRSSVL